jgi:hypothetical protein
MTFSHEDANARLLDLVYGEAAPAEATALEAHVSGCARCQADLRALGDTRARVRVAMEDEAPPARAHARILAAAAEAANGASAGAAATAPPARGNEPASRAARVEERPSFWERLRSKWTFPTLATAGAVAIFVLGAKVLLNPEKNLERGKQGLFPAEQAAPAGPSNAPGGPEDLAKAVEPKVAPPAPRPEANAEPPARPEADRQLSPQTRARIEAVRRYAHPRTSIGDLMGGKPAFQSDKLGGAPAAQALQGLRSDSFGSAGGGKGSAGAGRGAGAAAPAPAEKPAKRDVQDDLLEGAVGSGGGYATPPPNWKAAKKPAAPAAAAPPPTVAKKKTISDDRLDGLFDEDRGSSRAAPAPAAAPAPPRPAAPAPSRRQDYEEKAVAPEMEAEEAEAPARKSSVSRSKAEAPAEAKKEKDAPAPWEAPAKRADELYAARRWSEAAAAYNDLLRRFPTAPLAFAWRSRLTVAQRESAPKAPPAAAKKATIDSAPASAAPAKE